MFSLLPDPILTLFYRDVKPHMSTHKLASGRKYMTNIQQLISLGYETKNSQQALRKRFYLDGSNPSITDKRAYFTS